MESNLLTLKRLIVLAFICMYQSYKKKKNLNVISLINLNL